MTEYSPIRIAPTEAQIASWVLQHIMGLHKHHPAAAVAVADAFLDRVTPDWPDVALMFAETQGEADWWAEFASDTMIVAMLSAILKRLAKGQMVMAPNAKKRALVAIWNSLSPDDKASFLAFVGKGAAQ